ncbi:MAG: hypothetical protein HOI23_06815 [Deltaproteobacteria bacterium]|jgi:hypothetical protein|nr:hypothetical protein [Deltaproteobacteria bacterium]MBT6435258.1 hypothetical protein [Deltaproteobacteria bacterium]MBT6492470.1 hypothetical protein [Deltaproteobacteria bacterium]
MEEQNSPKKLLEKPGSIMGLGCLIIVTTAAVGAIVLGWLGHKMLKANTDPAMRASIAKTFLQTDEIPNDLNPVVAMTMRGTMELVVLSDQPLKENEDSPHFRNQGIYFMRVQGASMGAMPGEFEEQFLKPVNDADGNDYLVPSMRDGRIFESGNFQHSGTQGKFVSVRGTLDVFGWSGRGVQNRFSIKCSPVATPTLGIWFMKDSLEGKTNDSPLNIESLKKRLANFNFCPTQDSPPPTQNPQPTP